MRKISKIIFGISTLLFVIMAIVFITRKTGGNDEYISVSFILNYIEKYEGFERIQIELNDLMQLYSENLQSFSFSWDFSSLKSFMNSIGSMFASLGNVIYGFIKVVFGLLKTPFDFLIYNVVYVLDFIYYVFGL